MYTLLVFMIGVTGGYLYERTPGADTIYRVNTRLQTYVKDPASVPENETVNTIVCDIKILLCYIHHYACSAEKHF